MYIYDWCFLILKHCIHLCDLCVCVQIEGAMEELREEDLDEPLGSDPTKEDSLS